MRVKEGVQERASVGLSRVNQLEAKMTYKLVDYLVHCGVPPKSIAVLTPYKGYKMLIRKILMNTYRLSIKTTGGESLSFRLVLCRPSIGSKGTKQTSSLCYW
ncbi:hypothetical protein PsorP6_019181 [Peronosclerospora sorghi]|nr:hypothetical protein PsorP6_019181 [Peronosclerospora sorghi]